MAVRFDKTAGKRLARTANVIDYNAAYSLVAWVYPITNPPHPNYMSAITFGDAGTGHNAEILQVFNGAWTLFCIDRESSSSEVTGSLLVLNQWHYIWIVRESTTSLKLYLNGNLDITNTLNVSSRTASTGWGLGATLYNGSWLEEWDARVANVKVWQAQLTVAELKNETRRSARRPGCAAASR